MVVLFKLCAGCFGDCDGVCGWLLEGGAEMVRVLEGVSPAVLAAEPNKFLRAGEGGGITPFCGMEIMGEPCIAERQEQ